MPTQLGCLREARPYVLAVTSGESYVAAKHAAAVLARIDAVLTRADAQPVGDWQWVPKKMTEDWLARCLPNMEPRAGYEWRWLLKHCWPILLAAAPVKSELSDADIVQVINTEFPTSIVDPLIIRKIESVCRAIIAAHKGSK